MPFSTSCQKSTAKNTLVRSTLILRPLPPCLLPADVEISYVDAILGTTVKVTTLGNSELSEVDLKIPPGGCRLPRLACVK